MNGRVEADLELRSKIESILEEQPPILRQYCDSLSEYTWSTKKGYVTRLRAFFCWLEEKRGIKEITPEFLGTLLPLDINTYMSDIKYIRKSDGTIKESSSSLQMGAWSTLNSFYDFLVINRFVNENIVSKTRRPKNKDNPCHEYISQAQMKKLVKKVETTRRISGKRNLLCPRDLAIIELLITTGIRAETLREINVEDIDFERKTIHTISKGHKEKFIDVLDSVLENISKWLVLRAKLLDVPVEGQSGPLFISLQKRRMSYCAINDTVKHYTSKIGIEGGYSCHKIRHGYGTAIYMMTKDINYTKEKLGHANISTTQRYVNEVDDKLDNLVNNKLTMLLR